MGKDKIHQKHSVGEKNWAAWSGIKQGVIPFPADPFYVRIYTLTMSFSNPAPKFQ